MQHREKKSLSYHLYTIYLITRNDLKSIVMPETAFGLFAAMSGPLMTTNAAPGLLTVLGRLPQVFLWNWLNLLIFDIANQRLANSILEDSVNKPWRPIPAKRITPAAARRLLLAAIPIVFGLTLWLGGMEETVAMMVLTWMYNDLAGADENYFIRNIINAFGFMCYSSGAARVACGYGTYTLTTDAYCWIAIIGAIVFTTLQMQDMADQEGDKARNRGTAPLVLGDWTARWTIAVPVSIWSLFCPIFWQLDLFGYVAPVALGLLLAVRVICMRDVQSDKQTWKLWCVWTMSLYLLPLAKDFSIFTRFFEHYLGGSYQER
jgi:4-hydroxybenzoate polyprenyltransferase